MNTFTRPSKSSSKAWVHSSATAHTPPASSSSSSGTSSICGGGTLCGGALRVEVTPSPDCKSWRMRDGFRRREESDAAQVPWAAQAQALARPRPHRHRFRLGWADLVDQMNRIRVEDVGGGRTQQPARCLPLVSLLPPPSGADVPK